MISTKMNMSDRYGNISSFLPLIPGIAQNILSGGFKGSEIAKNSALTGISLVSKFFTIPLAGIPFNPFSIVLGLATIAQLLEKPTFHFGAQGLIQPLYISREGLVFTNPFQARVQGDLPYYDGQPQATIVVLLWVAVATAIYNLNLLPLKVRAKAVTEVNKGLPYVLQEINTCKTQDKCSDNIEGLAKKITEELDRKFLKPIIRAVGKIRALPDAVTARILEANKNLMRPRLSGNKQSVSIDAKIKVPFSAFAAAADLGGEGDAGKRFNRQVPSNWTWWVNSTCSSDQNLKPFSTSFFAGL